MPNHYEILGLPTDASAEEIDAAWRDAVKQWHPDRNRSAEASYRLQEINTAREVLSNPDSRSQYDRRHGFAAVSEQDARMEWPDRQRYANSAANRATVMTSARSSTAQEDLSDGNKEWWNRFSDIADRNARAVRTEELRAAVENEEVVTTNIMDRRPTLTRYVLMPAGAIAILAAAIVTLILV